MAPPAAGGVIAMGEIAPSKLNSNYPAPNSMPGEKRGDFRVRHTADLCLAQGKIIR
jgi:hypothetical protein